MFAAGCPVMGREHHKPANNALNTRAMKYFRGKVPGNNLRQQFA